MVEGLRIYTYQNYQIHTTAKENKPGITTAEIIKHRAEYHFESELSA